MNSRYTDAQIEAAVDELRAGGDPLGEEVMEHLTPAQLARYAAAVDREQFTVRSAIARAWLTDPALRGLDPPPFPVFTWTPDAPDDLSGL